MKKIYQCFIDRYFLNKKLVSRRIDENEIFIRTITSPKHHKLGNADFATRKEKELFLPYKEGVSLNRYRYITENKVKQLAKKMTGQETYAGFALFTKNIFNDTLSEYWKIKGDKMFYAEIIATPLNINNQVIENNNVYTTDEGNPSHADIIFNRIIKNEKPMPPIRKFSKMLAQKSVKKIDLNPISVNWGYEKFSSHFI